MTDTENSMHTPPIKPATTISDQSSAQSMLTTIIDQIAAMALELDAALKDLPISASEREILAAKTQKVLTKLNQAKRSNATERT